MSTEAQKNLVLVMVFGTFDGLHPGHLNFFWQAKKLSPKSSLIVSIARDKNVKKIKGKWPRFGERKRMALVRKLKVADKVILAGVTNHIPHILAERPNIIALGYDQRVFTKNLKEDLKKRGLRVKIVRLKPYREKVFKNHILRPR